MRHLAKYTIIALLTMAFVLAQNEGFYVGDLSFDYSGSINGSFDAEYVLDDTLTIPTSGAMAAVFPDSSGSRLFVTAFQPNENAESTIDLFLMVMTDEEGEIEPQSWDIEFLDIEDPLATTSTAFFIPEIDSTILAPIFEGEIDSSNFVDYILEVLLDLVDSTFFGTGGTINLNTFDMLSMAGDFSGSAMRFPFQIISIDNGVYDLTLPGSEYIPDPPQNLTASLQENQVLLEWDFNENEFLDHYNIYRGLSDSELFYFAEVDPEFNNFFDADLETGLEYFYYVTAVTSFVLESEPSNIVSIVIPGGTLGDINQDNSIDVLDIVQLVNIVLGTPPSEYEQWAGDLNEDGNLDVLDIVALVNIIIAE